MSITENIVCTLSFFPIISASGGIIIMNVQTFSLCICNLEPQIFTIYCLNIFIIYDYHHYRPVLYTNSFYDPIFIKSTKNSSMIHEFSKCVSVIQRLKYSLPIILTSLLIATFTVCSVLYRNWFYVPYLHKIVKKFVQQMALLHVTP